MKLTKEHIKLLQKAEWRTQNYGEEAPAIDSKRPFGFSHSIYYDMAEILDIKVFEDEYGDKQLTEEQSEYLQKLWSELLEAIEIILENSDIILKHLEEEENEKM